jgi:hypothetical protein
MSQPLGNQSSAFDDKRLGSTKIFNILVDWKPPAEFYNYSKKRKRGWKVVFWGGKSGATASSIDWGCPQCGQAIHADHTNIRRCPRCGLAVGEQPIIRDEAPKHIRRKEWAQWWGNIRRAYEEQCGGITDRQLGDQDGTPGEHKAPRPRRASSGARRKI